MTIHFPTTFTTAPLTLTTQPVESATRTITLRAAGEWRFQVPTGSSVALKVLSGTAEKDGVELAARHAYKFSGIKSKILTWHGCELQVEGRCEAEAVAEYPQPTANPATSYVNLHARLSEMRAAAASQRREGPRILVAGPPSCGKTTLVRTLTSYATRQGHQPIVVNADPSEGMLSLAGTLSASVFATVMDAEAVDGWGSTPTSGPSTVPVKLPLVYYYGRESAEEDAEVYRELIGKLAGAVSGRLSDDADVKSSGVIVDTMGVNNASSRGLDLLAHVVDELSGTFLLDRGLAVKVLTRLTVNIVITLGTAPVCSQISKRFANEKTTLGEDIQVVSLDQSDGVVDQSDMFLQHTREAAIKEYFFGDARRTLSPQIQQVDFGSVVIYRLPDCKAPYIPFVG